MVFRVKILLQAQNKHYKQLGVAASLKKVAIRSPLRKKTSFVSFCKKKSTLSSNSPTPHQVVTNEGTLALFKGNTAQMARITQSQKTRTRIIGIINVFSR